MQGFNYTQLYQAMQDWPYKKSVAYLANINRMIYFGELRLIRDLDFDLWDVNDQVSISSGTTIIQKPAQSLPLVFTAPLTSGALSGTLTTNWAGVTGAYVVTFSDNELQIVTLTQGQNTASWPQPGLAANVNQFAQVNSQFVAERSLGTLYNGKRKRLVKRSYDFVQSYSGASPGQPLYYCEISQSSWQIAPQSDALTSAILRRYVQRPPSIVVAGNTYLGDNFGDVLFVACLMESEQFLKADDRYQDMSKKYYQELLPNARGEAQILGRTGQYTPLAPVAATPAPPMPPQQGQ